jgi:hypothetical protein
MNPTTQDMLWAISRPGRKVWCDEYGALVYTVTTNCISSTSIRFVIAFDNESDIIAFKLKYGIDIDTMLKQDLTSDHVVSKYDW